MAYLKSNLTLRRSGYGIAASHATTLTNSLLKLELILEKP
jgi:hypothetical protein